MSKDHLPVGKITFGPANKQPAQLPQEQPLCLTCVHYEGMCVTIIPRKWVHRCRKHDLAISPTFYCADHTVF